MSGGKGTEVCLLVRGLEVTMVVVQGITERLLETLGRAVAIGKNAVIIVRVGINDVDLTQMRYEKGI